MLPLKLFRMTIRVFRMALVVGSGAAPAFATDYYLGSTAPAQPGVAVASIDALNALQLHPGDRVYFQGGETFPGTIMLGADDAGTATSPVELTSYGTGRATIAAGSASAVKIYNAAGFALHDLDLQGADAATSTGSGIDAGVYLATSTRLPYLRFERMRISGFKNGVEIWGWYSGSTPAWPGFSDVKLTGIEACGNRSEGIKTWGTWRANSGTPQYSHANVSIAHCSAWGNRGDPASTSHTGSGIILSGVDQGCVEYCVAHDNGGFGPATGGGPYGIWAWEARGVVLQYNLVYNQRSSSNLDGGAYDLDGGSAGCTVQYNYSYNNEGPGLAVIQFSGASPLVNSTVRYNISENDCRKNSMGVIYVGQFSSTYGVNGAEIFGNTIFVSANAAGGRPAAAAVQNQANLANVHLRNNVFLVTHTGPVLGGTTSNLAKALYQGNDYWGGSFDLLAFRTVGQEMLGGAAVGARVDPQLVDPGHGGAVTDPAALPSITAYQLKAGSPLIDSGLDLSAAFAVAPGPHDFYGVPIASASLDVGAAASTAATTITTSSGATTTSIILDDEFTGTGSLASRLPDTTNNAQKWSVESGTVSVANGLASANISIRATIQTGAADCTIDCPITLTTAGTGLILRSSDSANYLRLSLTSTAVQLLRTAAGSTTTLASASRNLPLGQVYTLRVTLSGATITVAINGATAATFTTSFNQTATRHGLLANGSGVRSWASFLVTQ
jgi:hypothetical protein